MLQLNRIHHIAIICKDYEKSKLFYTQVLGFTIAKEIYRSERKSYKADLCLNGQYIIELFSFPYPPERPSRPEAAGLRHIAFEVNNLEETLKELTQLNIFFEQVRIDEHTNKPFTFIEDPDKLPIEFYEK